MAQKQIPEYTDSQLIREIARIGEKKFSPRTEATDASWQYFKELVAEARRREKIYGHPLRHSQFFSYGIPAGNPLPLAEHVA